MDDKSTCCFSGHRTIGQDERGRIQTRLDALLDRMIEQGVNGFIVGCAVGFDAMAGSAVARKKAQGQKVRLILALPFPGHDEKWRQADKDELQRLIAASDEMRYISEAYHRDCYRERNYFMVDHSAYCVCAYKQGRERSGTGLTVRYAQKQGKRVINILQPRHTTR